MKIYSEKDNYSEQDPEDWWKNVCKATKMLYNQYEEIFNNNLIKGIGISYQMHGLVLVD
jgi:xylulokinase